MLSDPSQSPPDKTTSATLKQAVGLQQLSVLARGAGWVLCALALVFLVLRLVPQLAGSSSSGALASLGRMQHSLSWWMRGHVASFGSGLSSFASWIVIALTFACGVALRNLGERLRDRAENLRFKSNYQNWREQIHLPGNAAVLQPLRRMEDIQNAGRADREELLKIFAQVKKKLDESGRDLAFLSIDVVDSTGMKQGEDRAAIEHDFHMYKAHVESAFAAHDCLKSTWTPDGVMGCFPDVDAAINTARDVVTGLDGFNRGVKTMKRDFQVRCGINSGYVYFDEALPLEELSDRVLDIAGHLQKHAAPNTICVAQHSIEPTQSRNGFAPSGRIVDGYQVYEWKKNEEPL